MGSVNWKSFRPSSSCFILAGSPSAAAAAVRHQVCIVVSYVRCCGIRIHLSRLPTTAADLLADGRPAVADDRIGSTSASHRVASLGRLCHDGSLLFLLLPPPPPPSSLPPTYGCYTAPCIIPCRVFTLHHPRCWPAKRILNACLLLKLQIKQSGLSQPRL